MNKAARQSVQQHYIQAREILNDVLCLQSTTSPTRRVYRAVLEIAPINFLLKAEEEQDALVARYRMLLKGLTFPVQIMVRNQRLDLQPYLAHLQEQDHSAAPSPFQDVLRDPRAELAQSLVTLLTELGEQRTLIERHCYLVIPAPDPVRSSSRRRFLHRRQRQAEQEELVVRALQELDVRVEVIGQQLTTLGVRVTRLRGADLATLYHHCLTPERAGKHPLQAYHLAAVGRLPRVATRANATPSPDLAVTMMPSAVQAAQIPTGSDLASPENGGQPARRWQRQRRPSSATAQGQTLPPTDFLRLADVLAPGSIEELHDALCVGGEWVKGIAVTAFPREVSTGAWLAPLLLHDDELEIVFHLHPQEQARAMRRLKQRRAGYASTRLFNRRQGKLDDPEMDVAQYDVTRLMSLLASGEERLFEVSLLVLVRAPDRATLEERTERVMAKLQTVLLDAVAHPTTFEHGPAFRSFLPECRDELGRTITLDTTTIATTFPFLSNSLTMPGGVFLGITGSGELVLLDPWDRSLENPHVFIAGVTGGGKSYLAKLWIIHLLLLSRFLHEQCSVIDPEGEWGVVAEALNGAVVKIAPGSAQRLNPFDLVPRGCDLTTYLEQVQHTDRLAEKIQDLHSLLNLMLADAGTTLGAREKSLLDKALYETYRLVGITADPRTHHRQPPTLRDLYRVLKHKAHGKDSANLALRLSRYVEGSLAGLFSGQTNVELDAELLVWDVRDMRGELRPIGIFLIADHIWTQAFYQSQVRRCLAIDEAASILEHPEGGVFLANLSRRARKRYLRLMVMTQNPERFVEDPSGGVVAANAAIKVLKLQDRTSVAAVAQRFGLTQSEAQRLLAFGVHEALLLAGDRRVLLGIRASVREHVLITTNPVELAQRAALLAALTKAETKVSAKLPRPPVYEEDVDEAYEEDDDGDYDPWHDPPEANDSAFASTYDPAYGFFPTADEWKGLK